MISCKIDTGRLILGLDSLRDALIGNGQDASTVVEDEARRLARTIVAFVPPIARGKAAKQIGEGAVERDIKNLVSQAKPSLIDEVGSKYGVRDIRAAYVTEATGTKLNLQWDHLDPTGARLPEFHLQYRDSSGRIPKIKKRPGVWNARVVVPFGVRDDFIKKMQGHVGHWKATWAKAGARLGDKYPSWIARHFNSSLGIANIEGLSNRQAPSVTFGSRAGGNSRIQARVQAAVRARAKAIARRVKLILSGYNRDLAKGMRAQARAKDYREPQEAVE